VVRMASLAPVIDADELMRAIGAAESAPGAARSASGGGGQGKAAGARQIKVEGEVNAQAPRKASGRDSERTAGRVGAGAGAAVEDAEPPADIPELREFIRQRRAALAGFMEQGAALAIEDDVLKVTARSDIYLRYLTDNLAVLGELASAMYGRPIRAELITNGAAPVRASARIAAAPPVGGRPDTAPSSGATAPATGAGEPPGLKAAASSPDSPAQARSEARQAVYADPLVRRIFDELQARLVEVRENPEGTRPRADGDPKKT
jgi:hypothetical protein